MQTRPHYRSAKASRWAWINSPAGKRHCRAIADARREAEAALLPPIPPDPEPGSVWRVVTISDGDGRELHRKTVYVPARGHRCDQHAEATGTLCTATELGAWTAERIDKRPSYALRADARRDAPRAATDAA